MSVFTNPNFIAGILRSQGSPDLFAANTHLPLQALIEFETRKVVQQAIKLMRLERRDVLTREDVQTAIEMMGGYCEEEDDAGEWEGQRRKDVIHGGIEQVMRQQLQEINGTIFEQPKIKATWIYIKGKIPTTNENISLKSLAQIKNIKAHQTQEKQRLYNIIKDDPISLLSKEQLTFYNKVTSMLANSIHIPAPISGNLTSLLPFLLKFLTNMKMTDVGIEFLLNLTQNAYVWRNIEYHIRQVLALLIGYKGELSFEVGMTIGHIVARFSQKYPILIDIWEGYEDQSYSTILKKIAFELIVGVQVKINSTFLGRCLQQSEFGNPMAIICMQTMLTYFSKIKILREMLVEKEHSFIYWYPCPELQDDPYANMMF